LQGVTPSQWPWRKRKLIRPMRLCFRQDSLNKTNTTVAQDIAQAQSS